MQRRTFLRYTKHIYWTLVKQFLKHFIHSNMIFGKIYITEYKFWCLFIIPVDYSNLPSWLGWLKSLGMCLLINEINHNVPIPNDTTGRFQRSFSWKQKDEKARKNIFHLLTNSRLFRKEYHLVTFIPLVMQRCPQHVLDNVCNNIAPWSTKSTYKVLHSPLEIRVFSFGKRN